MSIKKYPIIKESKTEGDINVIGNPLSGQSYIKKKIRISTFLF